MARHRPRTAPYLPQRTIGLILCIALAIGWLTAVVALVVTIPLARINTFSVVARHKYIPSPGPIELALRGIPPNSSDSKPLPPTDAVHAIVLYSNAITLVVGGQVVRHITLHQPVVGLTRLAQLISDPSWLNEPIPGTFVLNAALITMPGVTFTVKAPSVRRLELKDTPGVFVGTASGTLVFRGVTVEAFDVQPKSYYRPFVVGFGPKAILNIYDSRFTGLGWNWDQSYGTSWTDGAEGTAANSQFDHGYFGAYTAQTQNVTFSHDQFNYNKLYGLDPHTYSQNLLITHVTADHNGAHGIIFSVNVRLSIVRDSVCRFNGENGIMMDAQSNGNEIIDNTVADNTGDGLVAANSPNNSFTGNVSDHNRVGIRIQPSGSSLTVVNNTITSNKLVSEGIRLPASNRTSNNGNQINLQLTKQVWMIGGLVAALAAISIGLLTIPGLRRRYASIADTPEQTVRRGTPPAAT